MDLQLTTRAQEAFAQAATTAAGKHHTNIEPAHLLLALAAQSGTTTPALLTAAGSSVEAATKAAESAMASLPQVTGADQPALSRTGLAAVTQAQQYMTAMGDSYVSTDHLLLAIARTGRFGLDADAIEAAIPGLRGGRPVTTANPEGTFEALAKYGTDLTEQAREGRLDPVIGRDAEIRRVVQVLSRRTKNNPV
ncbi:MAG: Clp protease N-terminal domain-containing protein, partial [Terracoccus sp.]